MKIPATVQKIWPGETVVCIGGGPSLTREDVEYCRGKARVIAVNDAYRLAPWADVLYACDGKWWRWHHAKVQAAGFTGLRYAMDRAATQYGIPILVNTGPKGLELKPHGLRTGMNSGYQAINLAVHLGARRIVLLGYDMKIGANQQPHWFGHHPDRRLPPVANFKKLFDSLVEPLQALGVEVVNCSRDTALKQFPRMALTEALP